MNIDANGTPVVSLAGRVYRTLQGEITTGAIRPGRRLVRREIAKRLGVSPIPVIEALLRLEQDGLVESRPNHGARVKEVTLETIVNECMLREAIECQVARLVAESATEHDLAELEAWARRLDGLMRRADPASVIGMELHMEFHMRLAEIAGYPLLTEELRGVWVRHLMQVNWLNAAIDPVPPGWHQHLVAALRSKDVERAEQTMRAHVRYGSDSLHAALRERSRGLGLQVDGGEAARPRRCAAKSSQAQAQVPAPAPPADNGRDTAKTANDRVRKSPPAGRGGKARLGKADE